MASRKPSISRASKKAPVKKARSTRTSAAEAVAALFAMREEQRAALDAQLINRIASLESITNDHTLKLEQPAPALVLDALVAKMLQELVGSLRGIEESQVRVAERLAELVALKQLDRQPTPRKPREPKAAPAEGVAIKENIDPSQGTPVPAEPGTIPEGGEKRKTSKPDRATCPHTKRTPIDGTALERCDACGATLDAPAPAAPAEKVPSFEELREHAVKFAQTHTKQKMLEVLQPFAGVATAADVKLSLIPEAKRAAAIAALEA